MKLCKHVRLSIYLFPLIAFLGGCVNSDYDLKKDIDTEITVGQGGLRLPLGLTEPIELNDFISESEVIKLENGVYTVQKEGAIEVREVELFPIIVTVPSPAIEPVVIDFSAVPNIPDKLTLEAHIERSALVQIDQPVQPELLFLSRSSLVSPFPKLRFSLKFDTSLPTAVNEMELKDMRLLFPSFFVFDGYPQEVILNEVFNPQDGFTIDLPLASLNFSHYPAGGVKTVEENGVTYLRVNDMNQLNISGSVRINTSSVDEELLQNIRVTPEIMIETLNFKEVEGKVSPVIEPITELLDLDFGDDLDFMQEDGMLDFHNPQIKLSVSNSVRVPVDAAVTLWGLDKHGARIPGSMVDIPQMKLQPAQVNGQALATNFLVSEQGTAESGYVTMKVPGLSNLFYVVPEQIEMYIEAQVDQSQVHFADVSGEVPRNISGEYKLFMPMQFEAIRITYREQLDDVSDFFGELSDNQDDITLQLLMETKNAIPLDLVISIEVLDNSGVVIESIESSKVELKAGTISSPDTESVLIEAKIPKGTHRLIDRMNILIEGSGEDTQGNIELREDQYVQFTDMQLRLYGGLSFDL